MECVPLGGLLLVPKSPIVAVVQLATQPKGVIHQVILRPDKVKGGLIRLGETPGDEANGWVFLGAIEVIEILGDAEPDEENKPAWKCVPQAKKIALVHNYECGDADAVVA